MAKKLKEVFNMDALKTQEQKMTIMDDLLKIEERLKIEGDTEQVRKAFWRIVGRVKRLDPLEVGDEVFEKVAKIRNKLFKKKVVLSVRIGILLFFFVCVISFAAFLWINLSASLDLLWMTGMNLFLGITALYSGYPLGRFLGGLVSGVKFEGFYRYSPGELGLKIEYKSYLKKRRRKWVFGTPIFLSLTLILAQMAIILPFNPVYLWIPITWLVLYVLLLAYCHHFLKTGELYRFIREIRIDLDTKKHA